VIDCSVGVRSFYRLGCTRCLKTHLLLLIMSIFPLRFLWRLRGRWWGSAQCDMVAIGTSFCCQFFYSIYFWLIFRFSLFFFAWIEWGNGMFIWNKLQFFFICFLSCLLNIFKNFKTRMYGIVRLVTKRKTSRAEIPFGRNVL
jgi:hypothetical protein